MRGKRLPKDIVLFIKEDNRSYRAIKEAIKQKWNVEVAKSTNSYYRRRSPRIRAINLAAIPQEDWQWLQGLFSADGNKIVNDGKYGKHYVVRISFDTNNDSLIIEKCARIIKAMGLSPTTLLTGNCSTIKATSKQLFHALNKIPNKSAVTAAYVAGAIDGDGWVDHRAIQFGQSHVPELFDAILSYFSERNIPVGVWTKSDDPNYRRMYIPAAILESTGILNHCVKSRRIIQRRT